MSTTDTPVAYTQAVDQLRARAEAAENERDALRAQIQNGDYLLRPAPPTISEVMLQGALQRAESAEKEREEWERSHGEVVDVIGVIAAALQVTRGGKDSLEDWTGRITAALGELRAQLEAVTTQRDHMRSVVPELEAQLAHWKGRFVEPRTLTPYDSLGADKWLPELNRAERERTEAQNRADAAEKERDDLAQKLSGNWIEREVDARVMSDFKEQTGPVAFERNQLRDELAQLRAKHEQAVTELNAGYDTLYDELTRTKADRDKHEHRAAMHERDADESSRAVTVLSTIIRASVEAIARGVK